MIDPVVRSVETGSTSDLAQLSLLETEARAALVDQRGGPQWLLENPQVGPNWDLTNVRYGDGRSYSMPFMLASTITIDAAGADFGGEVEVIVGYLIGDIVADAAITSEADARGGLLRVTQVWVTPEARELGFGDAMLAAALEQGKDAGVAAVEGQALPGDRHTKNLWERAGIVARLITTYRSLAD